MSKEELVFWGQVSVAAIGALGKIIVKLVELRQRGRLRSELRSEDNTEAKTQAHAACRTLKRWGFAAMIVWLLASLTSLAYVVWLPGQDNYWFVKIHEVSVIVAALAGFVLLVTLFIFSRPRLQRKQPDSNDRAVQLSITIFFTLLLFVALGNLGLHLGEWMNLAPSTKLMTAGFSLLNRKDYDEAIAVTEECSSEHHSHAMKLEQSLTGQEIPTGSVDSQQKEKILKNGVLNDVAACYWIKGRSAEKLQRTDEAKAAYKIVLEFPHARVWDSKGWFWSCAEDASDRLLKLQ